MKEYDFTLKFDLKNPELDPSIYVESLYESGCDDALIGLGQKGYIVLNFIREALSSEQAVTRAIAHVKNVIPFATLVETTLHIAGNNVSLNSEHLGTTKQANVREKAKGTARV